MTFQELNSQLQDVTSIYRSTFQPTDDMREGPFFSDLFLLQALWWDYAAHLPEPSAEVLCGFGAQASVFWPLRRLSCMALQHQVRRRKMMEVYRICRKVRLRIQHSMPCLTKHGLRAWCGPLFLSHPAGQSASQPQLAPARQPVSQPAS